MSDANSLCYIVVLAVSIACVIYGFMDLLKKKSGQEDDLGVIQRQLRGFGYLMLSHVVLVVGLALCVGLNLGYVKKMLKDL
jgi:hypothetical protein